MAGRGNHYFAVYCTSNHRFAIRREGLEYVEAKDLLPDDTVLLHRTDMGLTPVQEQILLGKLLGDGYLHEADSGIAAAVVFGHKKEHRSYLDWCCYGLGDLMTGTVGSCVSGYGTDMVRVRTRFCPYIKEKFSSFYSAVEPKKVPTWVAEELGPIALAFWYMDDGSLAQHNDQEDRANFAVCSFTEKDCAVLIEGLKKFGIDAVYYKANGYSRLRLNADDAEKLFILIAPYIPPPMQYKLPERYRGHNGWIPKLETQYKTIVVNQKVLNVEPLDKSKVRYDIETETHNFFANGVLVHNSNARSCFREDKDDKEQMFVGSHRNWKKEDASSVWWRALKGHPEIKEFCKNNPDIVVFGEVYGQVQKGFEYDQKPGGIGIRVFDLYQNGKWINVDEARTIGADLPWVPLIAHNVPFDMKEVLELAEGTSTIEGAREDHIREGVVIKPMIERTDPKIGRVQLKVLGFGYLENKSSKKRKKHQKNEKKDV